MPSGPAWVAGTAMTTVPSAAKTVEEGPNGVAASQAPTIGWRAISAAASWAAAGRARRETDVAVRGVVMGDASRSVSKRSPSRERSNAGGSRM